MKLGHYHVIRELGRGGNGTVYLAFDSRLEREVAIKLLHLNQHVEWLDQHLFREAKLLAMLNHPNIVQVYDVIEQDKAIVMEFVAGGSLAKMQYSNHYSLKEKLKWLIQISEGLAAAHELNIIHKDLKAENVLIDSRGTVKISDFGIADQNNEGIRQHPRFIGSLHAASPEQIQGLLLDHRTDLFSLGILAFELLCGRHPFNQRGTPENVIHSILHTKPSSLSKLNPDIPAGLAHIIESLLDKDPNSRPRSSMTVLSHFKEYMQIVPEKSRMEKETIVFTDHEHHNIAYPYSAGNNRSIFFYTLLRQKLKNSELTSKLIRLSLFFLILSLTIGILLNHYFYQPHYVVILPPKIDEESTLPKSSQRLIASAVYHALREEVTSLKGLNLIPESEIHQQGKSFAEIGRETGANEVVQSWLHCNNEVCDIVLELIGDKTWSVEKQKSGAMLVDNLLEVRSVVRQKMAHMYSSNDENAFFKNLISEEDYRLFLSVYTDAKSEKHNKEEILATLTEIQHKAPYFTPIYSLFRVVSLQMYHDSQDVSYLDKLSTFLKVADSNASKNIPQLVNRVWLDIYSSEFQNAENKLSSLKKSDADEAMVAELTATMHYHKGEYEKAINWYERSLKFRPNRRVYYDLAVALWVWLTLWRGQKRTN